jgi:hypothetical protein
MSPELLKVVERAQREPEGRFHSLAHRLDVPALERAYHRMRKDAAVGVDGITKEEYGQALEVNLQDLHARLVAKRYRHQPIRRVYIPKEQGKTRPIGISAFEDKLATWFELTDRDRRHLAPELAGVIFSGTPEQLRDPAAQLAAQGVGEIVYWPIGADLAGEF